MRLSTLVLFAAVASSSRATAQNIINTFAGGGLISEPATSADVPLPKRISVDGLGNIYISSLIENQVYKVDSSGVINVLAGNQTQGFSGDNGLAASAQLSAPNGLAVDPTGNVFIADTANNRVRRVDAVTGIITTIAGTGVAGFSGDGGPATLAVLNLPNGLAFDTTGSLLITDSGNGRIRRIDSTTQVINTIAGRRCLHGDGDGGPALQACLIGAQDVAVDTHGNIFIAELSRSRVRRVDAQTQIINTVAGMKDSFGFSGDGGPATSAQLNGPNGITVDSLGNLYIADVTNNRVRKVDGLTQIITTAAGNGIFGFGGDGGPATSASLGFLQTVTVDAAGNVFIADYYNNRIRRIDATTLTITTVAGGGVVGSDGGTATGALLAVPEFVTLDSAGDLYIADLADQRVRRVDAVTGLISTVAGDGTEGFNGDGELATGAELNFPAGVAVDSSDNLYVADASNFRIRRVDANTGVISTIAGTGVEGFSGDGGPATSAELDFPQGLALNAAGDLYFYDLNNQRIRRVDAVTGIITTFAGNGSGGYCGDGGPAVAACVSGSVALDHSGNLLIADAGNSRIRRVDVITGIITTVAGSATSGFCGDGGAATSACLAFPASVTVDPWNNLYVSDTGNQRIRLVDAYTGMIDTVAGNGTSGFSGDGGVATEAEFHGPNGIAFDTSGNLYVGDVFNNRIRKVHFPPVPRVALSPSSLTFPSQSVGTTSSPQLVTLTNTGTGLLTVTSIATTGDFGQTNTCGTSVAAGASCTVSVTFTPTVPGTRTGSLNVTDDGSGSPQSVALSGTGIGPQVSLSPDSLTFPTQLVGTTSIAQTIMLSNIGSSTLNIASIAAIGDFTQTNTCGSSLSAGAACTISVMFGPTLGGTRSGSISITDDAPASPQMVSLTGTGTIVKLSPASLTFSTQLVGTTSAAQTVTLTNVGTVVLNISSIKGGGTNSHDFSQTTTCGASLAGGASCTINLKFKPMAKGSRSASLSITDDGGGSPQAIALSGTGTVVQLAPTSLTFGSLKVGKISKPQTIILTNKGTTTLNITSPGITITGADPGDFGMNNTCQSSVAAGASCSIIVRFIPTRTGVRSASVSVNDDGGGSPHTVALSGTGT